MRLSSLYQTEDGRDGPEFRNDGKEVRECGREAGRKPPRIGWDAAVARKESNLGTAPLKLWTTRRPRSVAVCNVRTAAPRHQ